MRQHCEKSEKEQKSHANQNGIMCVNDFSKAKDYAHLHTHKCTHVHVRRLPGGKDLEPRVIELHQDAPPPACVRLLADLRRQRHDISVHPSLRHLLAAWLGVCRSIIKRCCSSSDPSACWASVTESARQRSELRGIPKTLQVGKGLALLASKPERLQV